MAILAITTEAGKPLSINDFTDLLMKTGYAKVRVEIDTGKPLKLGILIREKKGAFWQQFIYENLPAVCYVCGRLGHTDDCCQFSMGNPSCGGGDSSLLLANFVYATRESSKEALAPMVVEGKGG